MNNKLFISICIVTIIGIFNPATAQNPIVIDNARFTLINDGLVRMEYALNGEFVDEKTLFATNRDTSFNDFVIDKVEDNKYVISTAKMVINYENDGFPFGCANLKVEYHNNDKKHLWNPSSSQEKNLMGAIYTLDNIKEPIPRDEGLLSRDGWYVINDSNKEIIKDEWISLRDDEHLQDLYLFVYGTDYKGALKSLQQISGSVPMTRKYVHGSWYCRWWNYTANDYRGIVQDYKDHDFPMDMLAFDMGWHTQRNATAGTGHAASNRGWTGYSWNRELIPDPAALIKELKSDSINVVLNEHPHDGIRDHEDMYEPFMKAMGESAQTNLLFDAGDKTYMTNFMKYAHQESNDMGVAFWWLDWQQDYIYPYVRGTRARHIEWLNYLYYNYSEQNGENLRGANYSRWAGWGDHRHPIHFSGDAWANWDMLAFEVDLTSTSGNSGCFFWAHDIGGFYGGNNPELYARWTQFGALSSSLRIHSVISKNLDRRPWLWGEKAETSMRIAYHLRSQLIPYIYSSVWQCHNDMLPLNRAMYIDYPLEEQSFKNPQQYMFGDLLLVAPITEKVDSTGVAKQKVWLPQGDIWYNYFDSKMYVGGQNIESAHDLNTMPLFVKGGYPIPMQNYSQRMTSAPLVELIVRAYPGQDGANNSYTLYEDDGLTNDYKKGENRFTELNYKRNGKLTTIKIGAAKGKYKGEVKNRNYRFELMTIEEPTQIRCNVEIDKKYYDTQLNAYIIETVNCNTNQAIEFSCYHD